MMASLNRREADCWGGRTVIVVRFKVQCRPEKREQALAAFKEVIAPSRAVQGVISFDIGQDVSDPNSFLAIEVFEDHAALERQESLDGVQKIMGLFEEMVAAAPEATIYEVSSAEPHA
jgi:quinol monooxygenase YgiN